MKALLRFHWLQTPLKGSQLRFFAYYLGVVTLSMSVLTYAFMHVWHITVPPRVLWLTLPLHVLVTVATLVTGVWRGRVNETVCLGLLLLSLAILWLFLHDTGGHTNPLISLLLLPLAMSAATLSWPSTVLLALTSVGVYSTLTRYYVVLEAPGGHAQHYVMDIHLLGMWLTFAVSVGVIVGLITPMANSMRQQRELIARQQEKILRDETLVALATFAASAAHQLGTPLSTLRILTDDLQHTLGDRPEVMADLGLMQQQIDLCKDTLRAIMHRADHLRHGQPQPIPLSAWLYHLRQQFNLLNPGQSLPLPAAVPECQLLRDETLDQAMLNLLDNAARVSDQHPTLELRVTPREVILRILDTGPGIPEAIRAQLGQPFVSDRADGSGLGLGWFLSHATINRFGGQLSVHSSPQGTTTVIVLPRADEQEGDQ